MSGYIKTIKDQENATYGIRGGFSNQMLKAAGVVGGLATGHDTTLGLNGTAWSSTSAATRFTDKRFGQ